MDLGKVLTRAWEIIWKNKVLWIFGILASCASGGGAGGSGFNSSTDMGDPGAIPPQLEQFGRNMENFLNNGGWVLIVGLACLILLIGILAWVVGIFGKVGLIRGVLRAEDGRPINFRELSRDAWEQLGSALGLNLLLGLIVLVGVLALVAIGIPLGIVTLGIGLICLVCLILPLGIAFSIYSEVANVALIKERLGAGAALNKAWDVLRSNPGPLAGLAIVLFIIGLLAGLVMAIPVLLLLAPVFFSLASSDPDALSRGFMTSIVLFILALPILLLLQGVLISYTQSAWTLAYTQLSSQEHAPMVTTKKPRSPRTPKKA